MADCNDPECVQARIRLQEARNTILAICSVIEQLEAVAKRINTTIAAISAAILGLLLVLDKVWQVPVVGQILGWALVAAIGILTGLLLGFMIVASQLSSQLKAEREKLAAANEAFANAAAEVMAACPPECWEDLDQPQC